VRLVRRDPLSQRVHHHPIEMMGIALRGGLGVAARRLWRSVGGGQPGWRGSQG
jgi:hypothetical protein